MAFTWTTINIGASIQASHFNEIKNNIDTLADIVCPTYNCTTLWSEMPVSIGDPVRATAINEMRTATDAVHDSLPACSSENNAVKSNDLFTEKSTDNTAVYEQYDGTDHTDYDIGINHYDCSGNNGRVNYSIYATDRSTYNYGANDGRCGTNLLGDDGEDFSHCSVANGIHYVNGG